MNCIRWLGGPKSCREYKAFFHFRAWDQSLYEWVRFNYCAATMFNLFTSEPIFDPQAKQEALEDFPMCRSSYTQL